MVMFTERKVRRIAENGLLSTDEKIEQLLAIDPWLSTGEPRRQTTSAARTLVAKLFPLKGQKPHLPSAWLTSPNGSRPV